MSQNGRKLQTIGFSLLAYFMAQGGGKDCPVLIVYKNFILSMVSYYGEWDTLMEIKFGVFNFISLG